MSTKKLGTALAILAAALYALNAPFSKFLLQHSGPTMMAAFLYLGAGFGLFLYGLAGKALGHDPVRAPLTRKELPYTIAMIVLDIAAPILLMMGLTRTAAANASLLNNFEIVATSLIALLIFKEHISRRLWMAIGLVTLASMILGFQGAGSLSFDIGSLFVLGACLCWGFENNCTRMLSSKSSVQITVIKCCFSGLGSLLVARLMGEPFPPLQWMLCILALGFVAYGLSINFYIMAQSHLGAAKTSAFYSIAPFLGVAFSMVLGERPGVGFYLGLLVMVAATWLMVRDTLDIFGTDGETSAE